MSDGAIAKQYFPPERYESVRRSICNFRNSQKDIQDMYAAEQADARAQAEAEAKHEAGTELAAIKRHKSFLERNEEEHNLVLLAAKACMFEIDAEKKSIKKLLPAEKQDRANFARCMTVAAQLTAQIKPVGPPEGEKGEPKESGFLSGYMKKAADFYGNNHQTGIPVDTTEPKARGDSVLVDSDKPI